MQSDSELLHDSRQRAKQVLADSARKAQQLIDDAHRDAVRLLLEQQRRAVELLFDERIDAESARRDAVAAAQVLPGGQEAEAVEAYDRGAADLFERQQVAAQLLLEAQERAAAALEASVKTASCDVLMAGQREAAAILLEARLRIEVRRLSDVQREGFAVR